MLVSWVCLFLPSVSWCYGPNRFYILLFFKFSRFVYDHCNFVAGHSGWGEYVIHYWFSFSFFLFALVHIPMSGLVDTVFSMSCCSIFPFLLCVCFASLVLISSLALKSPPRITSLFSLGKLIWLSRLWYISLASSSFIFSCGPQNRLMAIFLGLHSSLIHFVSVVSSSVVLSSVVWLAILLDIRIPTPPPVLFSRFFLSICILWYWLFPCWLVLIPRSGLNRCFQHVIEFVVSLFFLLGHWC